MKKDMLFCLLKYGALYDEYFFYEFENKSSEYKKSFITEKKRYNYYNRLNRQRNKIYFDDKWKTYQLFHKYYKRDVVCIRNRDDLKIFCEFVSNHPFFILKPLSFSLGEGISVIDTQKEKNAENLFQRLLMKAPFIIEELIVQDDRMSKFHPQSVNTVRVTTILTGRKNTEYEVHIFCPFFRMGQNGNIVDNAGAGGIIASIDPKTGKLTSIGKDEANNKYMSHPNTGVSIKGFQIPRWEEAVNLAKELALIIPTNRYIGWDLALTDHGWVMVEGNSSAQFNIYQFCDLKGRREELDELCTLI
ncbi:MAG: hypothetical protein JW976_12905 [Syntrophaceae bacterium]|nr:hypothetical protein [Syntrophaceae bacterium]